MGRQTQKSSLPNGYTSFFFHFSFPSTTNLHEALREALDYLDANNLVNFSDFDDDKDGRIDSITFLHSGYAAEWGQSDCYGQGKDDRIWSHKWTLWSDSSGKDIGPWKNKVNYKSCKWRGEELISFAFFYFTALTLLLTTN